MRRHQFEVETVITEVKCNVDSIPKIRAFLGKYGKIKEFDYNETYYCTAYIKDTIVELWINDKSARVKALSPFVTVQMEEVQVLFVDKWVLRFEKDRTFVQIDL